MNQCQVLKRTKYYILYPMHRLFDSGCGTSGGTYWNCCTVEKPCNEGEGDCDLHSQCAEGLICGIANCIGPDHPLNADCCEKPAPTTTTTTTTPPPLSKSMQFE